MIQPLLNPRNFTADDNGIWTGTVGFDMNPVPTEELLSSMSRAAAYSEKICDVAPTETSPGIYRCGDGKISLKLAIMNWIFQKYYYYPAISIS